MNKKNKTATELYNFILHNNVQKAMEILNKNEKLKVCVKNQNKLNLLYYYSTVTPHYIVLVEKQ